MNPLWTPSQEFKNQTRFKAYLDFLAQTDMTHVRTFQELQAWSLKEPSLFWGSLWSFFQIIGDPGSVVVTSDPDPLNVRFFPEAQLNFTENMFRAPGDQEALVFWAEDASCQRRMTVRQLHQAVISMARHLQSLGVRPGDRVAGIMPNMPETVVGMLAAASIGAVWASCSPDFGVSGIVDRLGQIEPTVLLCCDRYIYHGKKFELDEKNQSVCQALPSVRAVIACSFEGKKSYPLPENSALDWVHFQDVVERISSEEFIFQRFPFDHPLAILFSSGTTGVPKCIIHKAGGVLLEHLKEHQLHSDIRPQDRVFYYSTCGWMMWNWQVSALASGATLLLFDGSPLMPHTGVLWSYAQQERMTFLGASAKYFDALRKIGWTTASRFELPHLRTIASTGSPLAPETFQFIYTHLKQDVQVASISGGTDILGCFLLGNPDTPVWSGELQGPSLGMDIQVFDEQGKPTPDKGELVCCNAFPSMPLAFWDDPKKTKYKHAYFDRFSKIWCHGDYVTQTKHGGMVIFGRSDATLNPGGVRIGTAEIYRQVEKIPQILESIVVGQDWDQDVRVILFVKLAEGVTLDAPLTDLIKTQIRQATTPRHVPAKIIAVNQIPRTKSGKLVELAVRNVIHNQPVANVGALANPEALKEYENIPALQQR